MSERDIQTKIMLAVGQHRPNIRLFRNNVGVALAITAPGRMSWRKLIDACIALCKKLGAFASPIKYGLIEGSGDLIGWESIIITPEMVGTRMARFLSLEVKTPTGSLSDDQKQWTKNVREAGGTAIVARSDEEALAGLVNYTLPEATCP